MSPIQKGSHVYGRRGRYIGVVERTNDQLMRIRDLVLGKVYYVPLSAVIGALPGAHEVFLAPSRDEIDGMGWLLPPHGLADETTRLPGH